MKNLHLWDVDVRYVDINADEQHYVTCARDGANCGKVYTCSHNLTLKSFLDSGEKQWSLGMSETVSGGNEPLDITYLSLPNSLALAFGNGELCLVDVMGISCDVVGTCADGLMAAEWSPDQELLVVVTKQLKMILMSCTFDPLHEVNLLAEEFGEKQFITVGWGKKETQFHGSEGKQAAKADLEIIADPDYEPDNRVNITWRGDANLYAIDFTLDGIRRFKIFDREGLLQYTSEKQHGLEPYLQWRPSGNIIATTQRLPDKYVVAFFEKNGLKRGGFEIPVNSNTIVEDIAWSSDSEILTLQCKDLETNTQKLLLFTMGNYHWCLKQTLEFNPGQTICKALWNNDFNVTNNKTLNVILCDGQYFTYSWIWNVDHSKGQTDTDNAVVVVIDGNKLLVTGFRQTAIPPPLAGFDLQLDSPVNSVHFAPHFGKKANTNSFFVVTADHKLIFYEQLNRFPLEYIEVNIIKLDKFKFPFEYYNWFWADDRILSIQVDNKNLFYLVESNVIEDGLKQNQVKSLPEAVLRIESHPIEPSIIFLELRNGDVMQYTMGGEVEPHDVTFKSPCTKFNVIIIDGELHFIGLAYNGTLRLDHEMVLRNVSSFFIHTHFLLITTLEHYLLCTELSQSGLSAISEYSKIESAHVFKRKIERGAKLVIAVPNATRTVLQMPRGNIEVIQPRPLSLKIIGQFLDFLRYFEAFDLMRKERINLNLIHDHDPMTFMNNINMFLDSIQDNSWLNLFLSDLENVDVTMTMYWSSYADKQEKQENANYISNKINKVCEAVRSHIQKRSDLDSRILPLLTTYVKTNEVSDLEKALLVIKDLKNREADGTKLAVGSDEALKYLLYMVDVNRLFDVALGMYDFDLVVLVSTKSQKDPKEYIALLNELNQMDENYKRFSINKHLKRFDKAVKYLVKCGVEKQEELKTFVKFHSLYTEALAFFTPSDQMYKQISEEYGAYLKLKKQFTEAGLIYEKGGHNRKAIECYKDALEWDLAINLAQLEPHDYIQKLCEDFANALEGERRYLEGLKILEDFYDSKKDIILYAVSVGHFKTAFRLCTKYNLPEYKEEIILPGVISDHTKLQVDIEIYSNTFLKYRDRLRVVRKTKTQAPQQTYDPVYENRDSDLYSDAGSTVASSRGSSRTYRSSKNRRKHERKLGSLKEGSQYEDVALLMALHRLVTTSFALRPQVREINIALHLFGRNKDAFELQTSLEQHLEEIKDSLKEIWTNELVLEATTATIANENNPELSNGIPQGIASLEPHLRIAPVIHDINWQLSCLTEENL